MKNTEWKTGKHTCNKCCNAQVKAGQQYCDRCNEKKERTKEVGANKILHKFGFHIS